MTDKNEPKSYQLKPIEANILAGIDRQLNGINSLVLSYIAVDRLAYDVKQTTQFTLSEDFKTLTISELVPAPQVEAAGETSTADAIKGEK